jgi:hypothetical protein
MSDRPGESPPELPGQSSQLQYADQPPPSSSGGCGKIAGIGCLVVLLLAVIGGVVAYTQARSWFAEGMRLMSDEVLLKNLELTPEQSERVRSEIEGFIDDFENEEVSWVQFYAVTENIVQGPLSCKIFDEGVVQQSSLPDEEKVAGSRIMQRLARGLKESLLATEVLARLSEHQPSGPNGQHTDEEVRSLLAEFKAAADEASIPDEPFVLDIAEEIEAAIKKTRDLED